MEFKIRSMEVPAGSTRNGRGEVYPFSKLEVGQGFFVPNSEVKSGDAVKTLKQTAYQAGQRFTGENARKFVVVSGTETVNGTEVKGANVVRVAVTASAVAPSPDPAPKTKGKGK